MCGIFFALSRHGHVTPDENTAALLRNRGPDHTGLHQLLVSQLHVTFLSTVLSLRGTEVVAQPLRDEGAGSVLCWNGEAWSVHGEVVTGNDSSIVFNLLLAASKSPDSRRAVIDLLSNIRGPYAIVFYDAVNGLVYYGRDCLGRRSLLKKATEDGSLVLSSVCDNATGEAWEEVEADGIYIVDLNDASTISHIPHTRLGEATSGLSCPLPFPPMNRASPDGTGQSREKMLELGDSLRRSLALRTQHVREAFEAPPSGPSHAKIAILFSGGLDCTLLARLCHDLLPPTEAIDLLNVAFENPRIHSALDPGASPYELCPDRLTGRASHAELQRVCPTRTWRFVEINVPYATTLAHRPKVLALMHPHNTEMDLSISCALYFASRGVGVVSFPSKTSSTPYTTPARVLLSGLGADELFGGYQRHATAFARRGHAGLCDELALDFARLGKRNLGRDDRVISDSGREVRFPFLDEEVIGMALGMGVRDKCDFSTGEYEPEAKDEPRELSGPEVLEVKGTGEKVVIEPAKRVLRCLAWELGMQGVAREKKRAIQFGARTAKMETGRVKGTAVLS